MTDKATVSSPLTPLDLQEIARRYEAWTVGLGDISGVGLAREYILPLVAECERLQKEVERGRRIEDAARRCADAARKACGEGLWDGLTPEETDLLIALGEDSR